MTTAQDKFKEMLKTMVAPRLRANGLTGSGQSYAVKSKEYWALIGVQKSMYSDSKELKFTLNLYLVSKEEWELGKEKFSFLPKKPTPNIKWQIGWSSRIGTIMERKTDYWWVFNNQTDQVQLSNELVEIINSVAVPALLSEMKNA